MNRKYNILVSSVYISEKLRVHGNLLLSQLTVYTKSYVLKANIRLSRFSIEYNLHGENLVCL